MSSGLILGGGVTGLAAGMASGFPVYEARESPGGICSSYYVRPGENSRLHAPPSDDDAYRFEIGGGHWIFGGDPVVLREIERLSPTRRYTRDSAVYFRNQDRYVDYPIQNNLRQLPPEFADRAIEEMSNPIGSARTLKEWLLRNFGPQLCETFFFPFHERYTAGLYDAVSPQDEYKSPVNLAHAIQGASGPITAVGYNTEFAYPVSGLDQLARAMGHECDLRRGARALKIDPQLKSVAFADGSVAWYDTLISTLPLNKTLEMAGLRIDAPADPYTSVLVLNLGAVKGPRCPSKHWLYIPESTSGFHRVGFYSHVDPSFLPRSAREKEDLVAIYVERAYHGGRRPSNSELNHYIKSVVAELTDWGYISQVDVIDPTWIDVAYTWERPKSTWKDEALKKLEEKNIIMVGRYARWIFQGIADSLKDGVSVGAMFRST